MDLSLHGVLHKALVTGVSGLLVGAGVVVLNVNKDQAVQDIRLVNLEHTMKKIDDIDVNVREVNSKVDVLGQKMLDDERYHAEEKRVRVR
jgi:outer membrane murein-binding lipoprotein Lpp